MQSQNLWELACYKIGGRIIAANEKKLVKKLESLYQQLKNRVLPEENCHCKTFELTVKLLSNCLAIIALQTVFLFSNIKRRDRRNQLFILCLRLLEETLRLALRKLRPVGRSLRGSRFLFFSRRIEQASEKQARASKGAKNWGEVRRR